MHFHILRQKRKRLYQSNTLDGESSKRLRERNAVQQGGQLEDTVEEPSCINCMFLSCHVRV